MQAGGWEQVSGKGRVSKWVGSEWAGRCMQAGKWEAGGWMGV